MLCLEILSFASYLHPHKRCVLVKGWLYFLIASDLCYVISYIGRRVCLELPHTSLFDICTGLVSMLVCCNPCPWLSPL